MMHRALFRHMTTVAVTLALVTGCTGSIADPDGDSPGPTAGRASTGPGKSPGATAGAGMGAGPGGSGSPGAGTGPGSTGGAPVAPGTDPGRVTLHRLNRVEYNNTVQDLLGTTLRPADEFPNDNRASGFDNVADSLTLAPVTAELYERAASRLSEDALGPSRARVLRCDLATGGAACAKMTIAGLLKRAWRRPVTDAEVAKLGGLVDQAVKDGDTVETGLKLAIQAMLLSPHFLFRVELDANPTSLTPHPLSGYELASRLSYFLWSTMPDDALFAAADGKLNDPATITQQVRRMLQSPKATAVRDNFGGQWLYVRKLDDIHPLTTVFPAFDEALRTSMRGEANAMFGEVMKGTLSAPGLLTADFTFLNARLARHYGLPAPAGTDLVRTQVANGQRGGLMTQGHFLAVTSKEARTSPVARGEWVLDQVLCEPPPEAPPGVPALRSDTTGATTLRQRLAQHRADPSCAACHRVMDEIGLALENYDAVGAYRTKDGLQNVDARGMLPDGRAFEGARQLGSILAADPRFPRCLVDNAYTYALGRAPVQVAGHMDPGVLASVTQKFAEGGHKLPQLIELIATSDTFRLRRGELETTGGAP